MESGPVPVCHCGQAVHTIEIGGATVNLKIGPIIARPFGPALHAYHPPMNVDPAALTILRYPHPALLRIARPVEAITDETRTVAARMLDLMREACGVGLAAPQVGLSWRLFVANSGEEDEPDRVYINPVLRDPEGGLEAHEEGCLSMPDVRGDVWRPPTITLEATDLEGQRFSMRSSELLARVWQHETDHLDGRLIIHRFGQMAKLANRRVLKELERAAGR